MSLASIGYKANRYNKTDLFLVIHRTKLYKRVVVYNKIILHITTWILILNSILYKLNQNKVCYAWDSIYLNIAYLNFRFPPKKDFFIQKINLN